MQSAYFYLGGEELHTGIYVDLIRRLAAEGVAVALVPRIRVSPDPRSLLRAWRGRDHVGPNPIETLRAQIPAGVRALPLWNLAPSLSAPRLARIVGRPVAGTRRVVLHARQIVMARVALTLKQRWPELRVICEMEGDDLAEIDYMRSRSPHASLGRRMRWRLAEAYYARQQRRILHQSDAVICVSSRLKDLLIERYRLPAGAGERFHVFPTSVSRTQFAFDPEKRRRARAALGLDRRFVVIYSGNLRGAWQVPDRLVEAFRLIRRHRSSALFLVLTPEVDRHHIEPLIAGAGIAPEDVRFHACPHDEVVDHLCAADLGLLLRERHLMNEVASPGKFAEYTLAGLPLLTTRGIGDFSAQLEGSPFACILPDLAEMAASEGAIRSFCLRDFTAEERASFSRWSADRFATERHVPRIADLYRVV